MLLGRAGLEIPAVVGNVHEHLRSCLGVSPDQIGKNHFVADAWRDSHPADRIHARLFSGREGSELSEIRNPLPSEGTKRDVFTERNQVTLIVASSQHARSVDEKGAVGVTI